MYEMNPGMGSVGLGDPCVQGSGGDLIDCGSFINLGQWQCWNPFATSYPCPGAQSIDPSTGGTITNPGTPLPGGSLNPSAPPSPPSTASSTDWALWGGVAAVAIFGLVVWMGGGSPRRRRR